MLEIKGFIKTSLVDWTGKICSVIFLPRCNFRCRYCHNVDLVVNSHGIETIDTEHILDYLAKSEGWIDGVCISGGEPTIHAELPDLCLRIKDLGLKVKLDTNGSNPDVLVKLLDEKLVDYIAVDIKAPPRKYKDIARVEYNEVENVLATMYLLEQYPSYMYEYRTTIHWSLLDKDDIIEISDTIRSSTQHVTHYLQKVRVTKDVLDDWLIHLPNIDLSDGEWKDLLKTLRDRGSPKTYLRK